MIDWSQMKTAEELRADAVELAWERIKAERDRRKAGGVLVAGHWFHSDDTSRVQWIGLKDTARDLVAAGKAPSETITLLGQAVLWKTLSGGFTPVTVGLAFDVNQAVKELDAYAFAAAEQHRMAMAASADPAAYDFSGNWPATYEGA